MNSTAKSATKTESLHTFSMANNPQGAMITFRSITGRSFSIASHLLEWISQESGKHFKIKAGPLLIELEGKGLGKLHAYLARHRVFEIHEGNPAKANEDRYTTWVDSIQISEVFPDGTTNPIFA